MANLAEFPDRGNMRVLVDRTQRASQRYRKQETIASLAPGDVLSGESVIVSVSLPCSVDQTAQITGQTQPEGLIVTADISAADSVRLTFFNTTGSSITAASGDYRVRIYD